MIRRKRLAAVLAVPAVLAIAWMAFHPGRKAEIHEVPPEVVAQALAAIPHDRPLSAAMEVRQRESFGGELSIRKQVAEPLTPAILRRGTKRYAAENRIGVLEESSSLTIGPIVLLRHARNPLPFIGDLLPNHFWGTSVLKRMETKSPSSYPGKPGSRFVAALWTEYRDATGEVRNVGKTDIECVTGERAPAGNLHASLTGMATKVRCEEAGAPAREVADAAASVGDPAAREKLMQVTVTESWYIEDVGISVQTSVAHTLKGDPTLPPTEAVTFRTVEKVGIRAGL